MNSSSPSDLKQRIESFSDPSASLEKKKANIEFLLNSCVANKDFSAMLKESKGILVLTTVFKNTTDFDLKTRITTLLVFLSLSGHSDATTENLMNDINLLSLVNMFLEKDFGVFVQVFDGLQILGQNSSTSSPSNSIISFSLSAATLFLVNVSMLIEPNSKVLTEAQKVEILGNFARFVKTGVMGQAAADAEKDTGAATSKNFASAYQKFVKTLESCHNGSLSNLDIFATTVLQLIKEGKLINAPSLLGDYLGIINRWLGEGKKYTIIYKASTDGFASSTFHSKCGCKSPTVTIITSSEGYVFGGYAAVAWGSHGTYTADNSGQSFLFSLKNPRNASPTKFGLIDNRYALYSRCSYGPTFSSGPDIYCSNNANSNNNSNTNLGAQAYSNTTGLSGTTVFTGQQNFTAKEIEVYLVQ